MLKVSSKIMINVISSNFYLEELLFLNSYLGKIKRFISTSNI